MAGCVKENRSQSGLRALPGIAEAGAWWHAASVKDPVSRHAPSTEACAEAVRNCLCFNLRMLARDVKGVYDEALKPTGLSSNQFALLLGLRLAGRPTKRQLAALLRVDRTALTRNLVPVLKQGLVTEAVGTDRRTRYVTLTPKGARLISKSMPAWRNAQGKAGELFGADGMRRLLNIVHDSIAIFRQAECSAAD